MEPDIERDNRELKDKIMKSLEKEVKESGLKSFEVKGFNIWSSDCIQDPIILKSPTMEYTI
jgi:hypothetical protein